MSCLQSLDDGVIAAMKARYRPLQMEYAVHLADNNVGNKYKVDIFTAIRWLTERHLSGNNLHPLTNNWFAKQKRR